MIKRRFYKVDHGDRDAESDDSSSSGSDADSPPSEEDRDDVSVEEEDEDEKEKSLSSPRSGYESEDSSGDEVDFDCSGFISNEEERGGGLQQKVGHPSRKARVGETEKPSETGGKSNPRDLSFDPDSCILKYKSVFKCKLCPNIICLNENTVRTHLSSKRHARSKKLLEQGRLKLMLNSDGEIEEEQETHAERHARTVSLTQKTKAPAKKDNGSKRRQRSKKFRKIQQARDEKLESAEKPSKKQRRSEDPKKLEESTKSPSKKQRKSEDPRKLEETTKFPSKKQRKSEDKRPTKKQRKSEEQRK